MSFLEKFDIMFAKDEIMLPRQTRFQSFIQSKTEVGLLLDANNWVLKDYICSP